MQCAPKLAHLIIAINFKIFSLHSLFSFQRIEEFRKSYDKAIADLENLHRALLDNRTTVRASESEPALKSCRQLYQEVQKTLLQVMDGGEWLFFFDSLLLVAICVLMFREGRRDDG